MLNSKKKAHKSCGTNLASTKKFKQYSFRIICSGTLVLLFLKSYLNKLAKTIFLIEFHLKDICQTCNLADD